jgi:hypothetical protein
MQKNYTEPNAEQLSQESQPIDRKWRLDELRSVIEKASVSEILKLSILDLINNAEIDGKKKFCY